MLATLLLEAGRTVPIDRLVDATWDEDPPPSAVKQVRNTVSRYRTRIGAERIIGDAAGYRIIVHDGELDARVFDRLVAEARRSADGGDRKAALDLLADALALWRGPALSGLGGRTLQVAAAVWNERRTAARETFFEHELALARHAEAVAGLTQLVGEEPLREKPVAQLMLALHRSGRRNDALTAFADFRTRLADELGLDPSAELSELHRRLLADDPRAAAPGLVEAVPDVPRQLPPTVRHFAGRTEELKVLNELARQPGVTGTAVISAIDGAAGIGKTALALHWAHQHTELFPDGQLYVNLRGFDPAGEPMPPAAAMRRFLGALDVAPDQIPADLDEQATLYRSRLAGRRMLIVLDNARDAEQVRPLMPGAPGCLVLVTSRDQLDGLVALEGALPLTLDLLTADESRELLIRRLGRDRVLTETEAADELIDLCARLPLGLNVAAGRAALHPERSLAELVDELRDARRRLDTLSSRDGMADVRAVFSWSYRTLDPEVARVFRLVGVHQGTDISLPAAANLAGLDLDSTRDVLDQLTRCHLIAEHVPGRYTFHDLLRAYAYEQSHMYDTDAEERDALRRACAFYTHTAYNAALLLDPHVITLPLVTPAPGPHRHPLADDRAATDWFDAEHANLLAAQQTAVAHAWHATVCQLAWALTTFHLRRAQRRDALTVWQAALTSAEQLPDPTTRIFAHRSIGRVYADLGSHQDATEHLHHALALAERQGDPEQQAHTHRQLASAAESGGDDRTAMEHSLRALDLFRALDQPVGQAEALNEVGWYAARLGDYDAARTHCEAALILQHDNNSVDGEAATRDSLGYIEYSVGNHLQAIEHYRKALDVFRGLGSTSYAAEVLDHLGHPLAALSRHDEARAAWREAATLYRQLDRADDAERIEHQLDSLARD